MLDVARARLHSQHLSRSTFTTPADVVAHFAAVQAQDFPGAKWALALRMRRGTDAAVQRAFDAGDILRTHILRPTWHFVLPQDIRSLLALTAPRVKARLAVYDRHLGIDARTVRRSNEAIAAALGGGAHLTRQELRAALRTARVPADGVQVLAHLTIHAELDGVICSGPLRGNQFTYALFDERVRHARALPRDAALAELARRYFTSHGPAQLRDFVWWSGLKTLDAREGIEAAGRDLARETIDGKEYWCASSGPARRRPSRAAYLLPLYDEYLIAYKDRSASLDAPLWKWAAGSDPFSSAIAIDGRVVGRWRRRVVKDRATIDVEFPRRLAKTDERLLADAIDRFRAFLGRDITVVRRDTEALPVRRSARRHG
jgi:DNA glycosylase AlkZ-like